MMPSLAAGTGPRWDGVRGIARARAGSPARRARADPAEADYLEAVGRPGDNPGPPPGPRTGKEGHP
jgi:hypothetical protein